MRIGLTDSIEKATQKLRIVDNLMTLQDKTILGTAPGESFDTEVRKAAVKAMLLQNPSLKPIYKEGREIRYLRKGDPVPPDWKVVE
mgnify:CR=1 FL=1